MIVGTAGHIDHGKTTLVRALTGVDTDRLKEEKARGISIELGYAYTPLASGDVLGFIDVPGHERLVHTMAAGASGIDFALLVVAADDGVMPQTREHLAILDLLGVTHGAVALTKVDRVDEGRAHEVETDIATLLATTPLRDAPIFRVDARHDDDPGIRALREYLDLSAMQWSARPAGGLFRLAVDRVFTLAGHGTIATGTVFSGEVRVGDTITILPSGLTARVRGIHAQNQSTEIGRAGQRCAINLAGVEKSATARGDWLTDARAMAPTTRIDVRLRRIVDGSAVHVHLGTAHRVVRVILLSDEPARAQLIFDSPVCAAPGDRFILRDSQATHTIGGGVVLDPFAPARRRRSPERKAWLDAIERMLAGDGIGALLAQAPFGLRMSDLVRLTCEPPERIALPADVQLLDIAHDRIVLTTTHRNALRERALTALREFHASTPDEPGVDVARLRRLAAPTAPDALWRALIDKLVSERALVRSGPWLHLPAHRVALTDEETALGCILLPLIAAGGFDPPWVRDLANTLAIPEQQVRQTLRKLLTQGAVFQIVHDLFYDHERVRELAARAATLAQQHGAIEVAAFRDALGLGRKRTVQILEFFDRVGYTRRVRDAHRLRGDGDWLVASDTRPNVIS